MKRGAFPVREPFLPDARDARSAPVISDRFQR